MLIVVGDNFLSKWWIVKRRWCGRVFVVASATKMKLYEKVLYVKFTKWTLVRLVGWSCYDSYEGWQKKHFLILPSFSCPPCGHTVSRWFAPQWAPVRIPWGATYVNTVGCVCIGWRLTTSFFSKKYSPPFPLQNWALTIVKK